MEFANQAQVSASEPNIFMILLVIIAFILNFWFCRYISIAIVAAGFIRKYPLVTVINNKGKLRKAINTKETTIEFQKLFFFWFVPGFGALSLIVLYISCVGMKYLLIAKHKLFLNHI